MVVTSIFSLVHIVFKKCLSQVSVCLSQGRLNLALFFVQSENQIWNLVCSQLNHMIELSIAVSKIQR